MTRIARAMPVALLLAAALLSACTDEIADEARKLGSGPQEYITFGPVTITKGVGSPGYGFEGYDPAVVAQFGVTMYPQLAFLIASSGYTAYSNLDTDNIFGEVLFSSQESILILFGGGVPLPGTYAIVSLADNLPAAGQVAFLYGQRSGLQLGFCSATGGSLTVSSFGAVDNLVSGTFSVTGLIPPGGGDIACPFNSPMPVAGAFRMLRSPDYNYGNDGRGVDFATLTDLGATVTESNAVLYDPILWGRQVAYTDPFTEFPAFDTEIYFNVTADPTLGDYRYQYSIRLGGVGAGGTVPFTYPLGVPGGSANLDIQTAPTTTTFCSASAGNALTLGAYGPVGGAITGSFSAAGTTPCPASFGASAFSVTREPDRVIPWIPTGDNLVFGPVTFKAVTAGNPSTDFYLQSDVFPESVAIRGYRQSAATGKYETLYMQLYNPLYDPSNSLLTSTTYTITSSATADGQATLQYNFSDPVGPTNYTCFGQTGTISVDSTGPPGMQTLGTINVSTFTTGSGPGCASAFTPFPVSGSFAVTRPADSHRYNDGTGTDTALVTEGIAPATALKESTTVLNDPVLYASVSSYYAQLTFLSNANRSTRAYDRLYSLVLPGSTAPVPGTYSINLSTVFTPNFIPASSVAVPITVGRAVCALTGGSVTFTAFGAAGQLVTGSYNLTSSSGGVTPECGTLTGDFSVTRS